MVCFETVCNTASLRIWDGDTFIIDRAGAVSVKIRIENIDAPEIEGRCAYEADLAQQSKNGLARLLTGRITIHPSRPDRYGRQLATVTSDGEDVGEILIKQKLARRWDGSRRSWCAGNPNG